MQPKLKSTVKCSDREVGEVTRIIMDPFSLEVSHLVVRPSGAGATERQVPADRIKTVTEDTVQLRTSSGEFQQFPPFERDGYVTVDEVEVAHLEDNLHVEPGEVLVPVPELERNVKRRTFFTNFLHAIGILIGLPLVYPALKYIMKPMYAPFDNRWIRIGNVNRLRQEDIGVQYKFKKRVKEAFMPEADVGKNVWVLKATPAVLESVYKGKDMKFYDSKGTLVWTNERHVPYLAFSGKCPHLGCGYKWRRHKLLGQVFLCPCHLSIYDAAGKVLEGPAPRPLDPVPLRLTAGGDLEIIDVEYKAGTIAKTRIV
ncbi:MAG: ubiquinol-cytochrome c reductase iron-sulfur subunit [Nitrospirales bacterium]